MFGGGIDSCFYRAVVARPVTMVWDGYLVLCDFSCTSVSLLGRFRSDFSFFLVVRFFFWLFHRSRNL